jgi:hypothetical protein
LLTYDELANIIASNTNDYGDLPELLISQSRAKFIWDFYLLDVKESMLIKQEEYSFHRYFTQIPFWVALLYTKLAVLVPGFNVIFSRNNVAL